MDTYSQRKSDPTPPEEVDVNRVGEYAPKRATSPVRLLLTVIVSIFVVEALVMALLSLLPASSLAVEALLDAILLVVLLLPVLYFFLFRPIRLSFAERARTEGAQEGSSGEVAHRQRLLLALSQAAGVVQRARTPEEVYRVVGDEVSKLGYKTVIFTLTYDREHLAISHLVLPRAMLQAAERLTGLSAQEFRLPLTSGGPLQQVMDEGKAVFAQTGELFAETLPEPIRPLAGRLAAILELRESIIALLRVAGEPHGLLVVNGIGLTEADIPAVTAFANQAAIALENVRLYLETEQRAERLAVLNEIAGAMASSLEMETVFPLITEAVRRLIGFDRASVALLDATGETMTIFALRTEVADRELGRGVQVAAPPPVLEICRTGRGIVRHDLPGSDDPFDQALVREGIRSALVAPLISGGQVIGFFNLGSREAMAYNEEQLSLLQAVADQIASAVENARLYVEIRRSATELQRRVSELSAFNVVVAIVNESLDEEEILNRAMDEALRLVGVGAAGMVLLDEAAGELVTVAHRGFSDELLQVVKRIKLSEPGLSAQAVQTGHPVVIGNIREYPGAGRAYVEKERTQSAASIPLIGSSGVIGVMNLGTPSPDYFDAAGLELLVALGRQIAIGVERARLHDAVRESEERFRIVAQSATDAIVIADSGVNIISWNMGAQTIFGYRDEEVVGKPLTILMPERYRDAHRQGLEHYRSTGESRVIGRTVELHGLRKDGDEFPLELSLSTWEKGESAFYGGIIRDITERKRVEREIEERRLYLEGVLESAPDAIITTDALKQVVEWNSGAERLFGYSREQAIGQPIDRLITNAETLEEAVRFTDIAMNQGQLPPVETVRYRKDGFSVDVIVAASYVRVSNEPIGLVAVYTDISERKRAEQKLATYAAQLADSNRELERLAIYDELTGLYNRRELNRTLQAELERSRRFSHPMAVVLFDVDEFKAVNDTHGHPVGDKLLRWLAQLLREQVRVVDQPARFGGDEFAIVLPETGASDALMIAERFRQIVAGQPFTFTGEAGQPVLIPVTVSLGVAGFEEDVDSMEALLAMADQALYAAKRAGRNCAVQYRAIKDQDQTTP